MSDDKTTEALEEIARQNLTSEMQSDALKNADFLYAYDKMITRARIAIGQAVKDEM